MKSQLHPCAAEFCSASPWIPPVKQSRGSWRLGNPGSSRTSSRFTAWRGNVSGAHHCLARQKNADYLCVGLTVYITQHTHTRPHSHTSQTHTLKPVATLLQAGTGPIIRPPCLSCYLWTCLATRLDPCKDKFVKLANIFWKSIAPAV